MVGETKQKQINNQITKNIECAFINQSTLIKIHLGKNVIYDYTTTSNNNKICKKLTRDNYTTKILNASILIFE